MEGTNEYKPRNVYINLVIFIKSITITLDKVIFDLVNTIIRVPPRK